MTKAKNYKFSSFFDGIIVNEHQLSSTGETLKKTLNPLKLRGQTEVRQNQHFEDEKRF